MSGLLPGEVVRRQHVEAVAGEGAQAAVYRVRDVDAPDVVWALKALRTDGLQGADLDEAVELFSREARFLCGLGHPGFPRVVDFFAWGGTHFQVMDYVEGRTLQEMVAQDGPMSEAALLPIAHALASHLAFLHGHPSGPIVYRDVKPSNVMVGADGRVTLLDFGIARVYQPWKQGDTQPLGTPGFAAPEQYGGGQSSPASDVYAFGATLYYCLTGVDPPPLGVERAPLRTLAPGCSPMVERLLAGCLRSRAERRPASALGLVSLLDMVDELQGAGASGFQSTAGRGLARDAELCLRWLRQMLRVRMPEVPCGPRWLELCAAVVLAVILALGAIPNWTRARPCGQTTACKSNLKNTGTALEMYSTDNHGRYPRALGRLTPDYLKRIPSCPSVGSDTYSAGYVRADHPDAYTVVCSGCNHGGVGLAANYPQYTSAQGLVEP